MKTKIVMTAAVVLFGVGSVLRAQDMNPATNSNPNLALAHQGGLQLSDLYPRNQLTLEAFGLGTISQYTIDHLTGLRIEHHSRLGAGAGLEYFICRYVGVEAEGWSTSTHHSFVDDFGGNLVLRWPLAQTGFAPYAFGGGGHECDPAPGGYADGGAGLEYRFNPHFGLFADARFVLTDRVGNYGMGRFGLRFNF